MNKQTIERGSASRVSESEKAGALGQISGQENTPAYRILQDHHLLETKYRVDEFDDIFTEIDLKANTTASQNCQTRCCWAACCGIGLCVYGCTHREVTVEAGQIGLFTNDRNEYLFAQPGMHNIFSVFTTMAGNPRSIQGHTEHGNRTVVTVDQGMLGYATDRGQPVLLPPGLHSWTSETLRYKRTFDLNDHAVSIGPYTLLTVDEGYAAITQNNGRQLVLPGGETHLLTHQKWKFEKFITLKIQTDDLERIEAASADNIIMHVNSTVVWRIKDVQLAATMAAETMALSGKQGDVNADITKLRKDVLKQAIASLASFIGSVNYSDSFNVAAAAQRTTNTPVAEVLSIGGEETKSEAAPAVKSFENPLFDEAGMTEAVKHANTITMQYGVEITSINIISANPVDRALTASLASGAVAAAEALQAETAARGQAKAITIDAEAQADTLRIQAEAAAQAEIIKAKASAESETMRAEGSKKAAELLGQSDVAVALAKMDRSAAMLKQGDKFFFGQEPAWLSQVVLKGDAGAAIL